jgi:hypothetical protein
MLRYTYIYNHMKKALIFVILGVILFLGFWFFIRPNYFGTSGPNNLPTAGEIERMKKIEESSSKIAPNAVPGAGVRPVGSLPKTPPPSLESTTTASSSSEELP